MKRDSILIYYLDDKIRYFERISMIFRHLIMKTDRILIYYLDDKVRCFERISMVFRHLIMKVTYRFKNFAKE